MSAGAMPPVDGTVAEYLVAEPAEIVGRLVKFGVDEDPQLSSTFVVHLDVNRHDSVRVSANLCGRRYDEHNPCWIDRACSAAIQNDGAGNEQNFHAMSNA
jgi:hypothetical protein